MTILGAEECSSVEPRGNEAWKDHLRKTTNMMLVVCRPQNASKFTPLFPRSFLSYVSYAARC